MPVFSITDLKQAARDRADMRVSGFISESELLRLLNQGIARLYGKLEESNEDFSGVGVVLAPQPVTGVFALPVDFSRMLSVVALVNGDEVPLSTFERREQRFAGWRSTTKFILQAQELKLTNPIPFSLGLRYIPKAPVLSDVGITSITLENGWDEYVTLYAAIRMCGKEESSTQYLRAEMADVERDIELRKQSRNNDHPHHVVDVDGSGVSAGMWGPSYWADRGYLW
jgi:hypothetical protein